MTTSPDGETLWLAGKGAIASFDGTTVTTHTVDIRNDADTSRADVLALAFYKGEIVIAGKFGLIGSTVAKGAARYHEDPETGVFAWEEMGQGIEIKGGQRAEELLVVDGRLFIAGQFIADGDGEKMVYLGVYNDASGKWDPVADQTDVVAPPGFTLDYIGTLGTYSKKLNGGQ